MRRAYAAGRLVRGAVTPRRGRPPVVVVAVELPLLVLFHLLGLLLLGLLHLFLLLIFVGGNASLFLPAVVVLPSPLIVVFVP